MAKHSDEGGTLAIQRESAGELRTLQPQLADLLCDAVASGASIGFVAPLSADAARAFWEKTIAEAAVGSRVVYVALLDGAPVGCVHLALAAWPNAQHRAEVLKLMVHTRARGRGIGRALMVAIEDEARRLGRSLLVLDTRSGDPAERLYRSLGYIAVGAIPRYALSPDGGALDATIILYHELA